VTQRTLVLTLGKAAADALAARLDGADFEWRSPPHSRFQVRGDGVVATLYTSGKLVVQGAGVDAFELRFLGGASAPAAPAPSKATSKSASKGSSSDGPAAPTCDADVPTVGSDETGKGDYFGPLVVAAVRLEPDQARDLAAAGVMDSKRVSDVQARRLGAAIAGQLPCQVRRIDPPEYNLLHKKHGNLNLLLAEAHAEVLRPLARDGDLIVVDQFGPERLVQKAMAGAPGRLTQRPRAEEITAVAAASIVARQVFLDALAELSEEFAIDLAKGAGTPTDKAARAFVKLHGVARLGAVAKLHFKTTTKLGFGAALS
jgi:ribonuclease HIII